MKILLALSATLLAAPAFAANLYACGGTEPFWDADISNNSVMINFVGEEPTTYLIKQRTYPMGTPETFGEVIQAVAPNGAKASITIRKDDKCNDGMSEQTYTHEIWFLKGDKLVVGCCNSEKTVK